MATMLRSLAHRNFRLFFIGQGMSLIGTWMQTTAMAWLVNDITAVPSGSHHGDPFWLTMVVFANQIPGLVLGPISGVVTDRFRRRPILYITQTLMMLQAFILAWLAYSGTIAIWHLIVLGALLGMVSTFDVTARQAFLTQMVGGHTDDLANAIALNSSLFNGARLIGPALAGGMLALGVKEGTCFLLNGFSYLAVLGGLWAMRLHEAKPAVVTRGWRTMVEGARYTFGSRPILAILLLVAVVSLVGTPYAALLPIFAVRNLHGEAGMLGLLTAASGVGALAGALYMAARKTVLGLGRVIAAAPAAFGVGLIVFAFSTTLWLSLPALALMGFAVMTQMASCNTILQTIVDEDKRGRVMSFYATAFLGFAPMGALAAGGLAELFGAPLTVAVGGVVCIAAAGIFASQLPGIRNHVRPIYRRIGILPEVVHGIQEASEPRTAMVEEDLRSEKGEGELIPNSVKGESAPLHPAES